MTADNTAGSAQQTINVEPGQNIVLTMAKGQHLVLAGSDLDVEGMTMNSAGELVIKLSDGATVTIRNFGEISSSGSAMITLPSGQALNAAQLADALAPSAKPVQVAENAVEPAPTQEAHIVKMPAKGEDLIVKLQPGDEYSFAFNMTDPASVKSTGGQLVIAFKNGGEIIIPNYGAMKDAGELPAFTMKDGTQLPVSEFGEVLVSAAQLNQIEPAAGEAGGASGGGFGFGSVFTAGPLENLNAIGPIAPTVLQYEAPDRQPLPTLPQQNPDFIPQIITPPTLIVDETDLPAAPLSVSGTVVADFFADGPGTFGANGGFSATGSVAGGTLTSEGFPVTVTLAGGTYTGTANGNTIFTITINSDGTYTFDLLGTLDHADVTDPDDAILLGFGVTATDNDGDTASTFITIRVDDDGPAANDDFQDIDNAAVATGNVIFGVNGGPGAADYESQDDGNTVTSVSFNGTAFAVPAGGSVSVAGDYGTLVIHFDGTYEYTRNPAIKGDSSDSFTYTLTDGDGDSDTAILRIDADGVPEILDPNPNTNPDDRTVDETGLSGGPQTVTGTIQVDYFTDTPGTLAPNGSFSFTNVGALTSEGHPVTVTLSGDTWTGTANGATVFTLDINTDGSYTFTLFGTLDHDVDGSSAAAHDDPINLTFGFTATDSDGDTDTSELTIIVRDDGPVAHDDFQDINDATVATGNVITGTNGGPGAADELSEDDGNSVTSVSFNGTAHAVPAGGSVSVAGDYGTLVIFSDGSYEYTRDPAAKGDSSDSFTYTLTDGDGDTSTANLRIDADGKPEILDPNPNTKPEDRTVDESDLTPSPEFVEGTISVNYFTDTPGSIAPNGSFSFSNVGALTSEGHPVTVTLSGDTWTGTANGVTIFTLTIEADGDYRFDLFGTLDHPTGDHNEAINLTFGFTATDSDGDTDTSELTILVRDDGPVARDDFQYIDDATVATGNVITGLNGGATAADDLSEDDGNSVTSVSFNGTAHAVPAGGSVSVAGDYGTLVIYSDGTYEYTRNPAIKGDSSDSFTYTLTDGDGDTSTANLRIDADGKPEILDPNPNTDPAIRTVDESDLTPGPEFVEGTISVNYFTDTPGSIAPNGSFSFSNVGALTSEGHPVTVTLSGNTWTGTANGVTIFTLTIEDDGDYRFDLFGTLDHDIDGPSATDHDDPINLTFGFTATDNDGDTDTSELTIIVKDDGPVAHNDINQYNTAAGGADGNVITGVNGGPGAADELSQDDTNTVTKIQFGSVEVDVPAGGSATIQGDHGTLTIHSDGSYTYVLDGGSGGGSGSGGTTIDVPRTFAGNTFPASLPESVPVTDPNLLGEIHSNMTIAPDTTITGQITFEGAGYTNSLGLFTIAADGTLQAAEMVAAEINGPGASFSVDPTSGATQLGFFIIADGFDTNGGYAGLDFATGELNFVYHYGLGDARPATINDAGADVTLVFTDASSVDHVIQGPIYFTTDRGGSNSLNPDGLVHTISGVDASDPNTLTIGFEDLPNGGDKDYNDLVFDVQITDHVTIPDGGDVKDKFTYTLTDGDGDTSTALLCLDGDGIPVIADPAARTVDESDLGPISIRGTFHADFFTDGPGEITPTGSGSFSFGDSYAGATLTSDGHPVTVTLVGDTYNGMANGQLIFSLRVESDGDYTFNLFGTLDHKDVTDPDDEIQLNFGITATDSDGDTDTTTLTVNVRDDGPVANDDTNSFNGEDLTTTGNVISGLNGGPDAADDGSADTPNTVTSVTFGGTPVAVPAVGTATIIGTHGTLVIAANGNYTYTLKPGVKGDTSDSFTYTLTDSDGDSDPAILKIKSDGTPDIFDPNDPNLSPGARVVDETNLAPTTSVSGDLNANFYTDTPGKINWTGAFSFGGNAAGGNLTSDGHPVTVALSGNTYTGTANGAAVFTLTVDPDNGNYTFTLLGTLDHSTPDHNEPINLNFGVKATDSDGDIDTATLTITVLDDGVTANDDRNEFEQSDGGASGNVITGLNGGPGAADDTSNDDPSLVTQVSFGTTTVDVPATGTATIEGDYGFLTIASDGSYTYTLKPGAGGTTTTTTTTASMDPTSAHITGTQSSLTLNGITVSVGTPLSGGLTTGKLSWVNEGDGAGIGISGNGSNKVWQPGEVLKVSFAEADKVTLTVADIGSNNFGDGIDYKVYLASNPSSPVTLEFTLPSFDADGLVSFTVDVSSFAPGDKIVGIDLFSIANSALETTSFTLNNVVIENTTTTTVPGGDTCDQFTYVLTDDDGDSDTAILKLKSDGTPDIFDPNDPNLSPGARVVDETSLAPTTSVTGDLNANFYTDTPGTITGTGAFSFGGNAAGGNLTSDGHPVTVTLSGNTYTGTANGAAVFTLTVNPDNGNYTFTLLGTLDHSTPDHNEPINLHFGVKATDSDGDVDTATLTITVLDDGVTANDDRNTFLTSSGGTDGNVVTGLNGGAGAADDLSNDDPSLVTSVSFGSTTVNVPASGTAAIDGDYGRLTIAADGSYTYTLFPGVGGTSEMTTIVLRDTAQGVKIEVDAIETAAGVQFTIRVVEGKADLNGFFLDLDGDGGPIFDLGGGNNMNPSAGFDYAFALGSVGGGDPDVTQTTVTVNGLTLADVDDALIGIRATSTGPSEQGSVKLTGAANVTTSPTDTCDAFTYVLTDDDGDHDSALLTLKGVAPVFKVGENVDDDSSSTTPYEVGGGPGVITGFGAGDVLVGDVGGSSLHNVDKDYNVVLILDVSGSMSGSKLTLLKGAVNNLLQSFNNYNGGDVKVHFVTFAEQTKSEATFTVTSAAQLASAVAFVNGLSANGYTNYEDPMQDAITWLQSTSGNAPIAGAETYTYFVSDGSPNRYVNGSDSSAGSGTGSDAENRAMYEIQGLGTNGTGTESDSNDPDGIKNEVAALKSLSTDVIGVGIGVNATTLARLDIIDKDGDALDVKDPNDLDAALQGASPLNQLAAVGDDVITGGDGEDFIFGDSLFTDDLADAQGLSTIDGAGWEVFAQLEAGGIGWTRADTIAYIKAHAAELAQESLGSGGAPRAGGNDILNGGGGDDVIFGQEGDDVITGGLGADTVSGGSGADTFVFHSIAEGGDVISDFNAAEGDKLDLSDILTSYDPLTSALHNFVQTVHSGADTIVKVDPTGTGAAFQIVAVLEGVHVDVDVLAAGGNLIA